MKVDLSSRTRDARPARVYVMAGWVTNDLGPGLAGLAIGSACIQVSGIPNTLACISRTSGRVARSWRSAVDQMRKHVHWNKPAILQDLLELPAVEKTTYSI